MIREVDLLLLGDFQEVSLVLSLPPPPARCSFSAAGCTLARHPPALSSTASWSSSCGNKTHEPRCCAACMFLSSSPC